MKTFKKLIVFLFLPVFCVAVYFGYHFYKVYFKKNINGVVKYLYVATGSQWSDLYQNLKKNRVLLDISTFEEAAQKMELSGQIHPGRYVLSEEMTNRRLINLIKSGNQSPLRLKIHNIRTISEFARYVSLQLECDSIQVMNELDSVFIPAHSAFNKANIYTLFIPNTYEMYWNTSAPQFVKKMYAEYQKFWNNNRKAKADALQMTPQQVTILASIVDAEALFDKEMPIIAGLYINRLKRGIKLQADPTVIYAHQDFSIRRVTNRLLSLPSPYNTYYVQGLPPGPIMMPSINAIDAVLNYERNNYLYMCAKEDFSGYHNFATNVIEHKKNARLFQKALNQKKIFK